MESNEEGDQSEQESHSLGVGRWYECVFCKRGFTTAQALGGHMNIHRKDRAKTKPSSTSNKYEENYAAGPSFYQPIISSHPPVHYAPSNEAQQISCHTFFPSSTSGPGRHFYANHHDDNSLQDGDDHHHPDSFQDDWSMRLSSQYNPTLIRDMKKVAAVASDGERRENDLDLELRLGTGEMEAEMLELQLEESAGEKGLH